MASEQEQAAIIRELKGVHMPRVVDLGAYRGEEYQWMRHALYPLGRYVAVEADPRNAAVIKANFPRDVLLIEAAIGATSGVATLHLCDNQTGQAIASSSIRAPKDHLLHFDWCTFRETIKVPMVTLDEICSAWSIDRIDLLWCDIQGAERDMIAGATEALKRTRLVMIEAEEVEMYEGQALKPELLAMLPDFDVVEDFGYNVLLRRRGA